MMDTAAEPNAQPGPTEPGTTTADWVRAAIWISLLVGLVIAGWVLAIGAMGCGCTTVPA